MLWRYQKTASNGDAININNQTGALVNYSSTYPLLSCPSVIYNFYIHDVCDPEVNCNWDLNARR